MKGRPRQWTQAHVEVVLMDVQAHGHGVDLYCHSFGYMLYVNPDTSRIKHRRSRRSAVVPSGFDQSLDDIDDDINPSRSNTSSIRQTPPFNHMGDAGDHIFKPLRSLCPSTIAIIAT